MTRRLLPLTAALGLGAHAGHAQAPRTDSAAVVHAIAAFDVAWVAKDTAVAARWLAPSYQYFTSAGGVWSRAQTLALLAAPEYRVARAARTALSVRLVGPTAVVSSRWQGQGTYPGGQFDDDQRCSLVLAKVGRAWRLLAEHCTQIQPAAS
jgi:Domain of unknown function (DUF4440)